MGSESEVYRFVWRSTSHGRASVRIGRQGDRVALQWRYRRSFLDRDAPVPALAALSHDDWLRFQDVLITANLWSLDPMDDRCGFDGAEWLIEGRRGNIYRGVSRWSPVGSFHDLGRLFCSLAGPPLSGVRLY
jgi:hypothetical protein